MALKLGVVPRHRSLITFVIVLSWCARGIGHCQETPIVGITRVEIQRDTCSVWIFIYNCTDKLIEVGGDCRMYNTLPDGTRRECFLTQKGQRFSVASRDITVVNPTFEVDTAAIPGFQGGPPRGFTTYTTPSTLPRHEVVIVVGGKSIQLPVTEKVTSEGPFDSLHPEVRTWLINRFRDFGQGVRWWGESSWDTNYGR